MKKSFVILLLMAALIVFINSCNNPFAPGVSSNENLGNAVLGDQTTVEGVFENFRYAYTFRDTVVYSKLLDRDFTFEYYDYDKGVDVSWGREEDMRTTYRLFQSAQNLDLNWNEVIIEGGGNDSLKVISRGFSLSITFSSSDVVSIYGRVNLRLIKRQDNGPWKILKWKDESVY